MAAAPTVQTLDQVMAELSPGISQQNALIDKQRSGLATKYGAQKQGLEAQKVEGFNQINNQATGRGMSFSGIPIDEQANYLATKYLPGVAALDQQQNDEDIGLQTQAAKLQSELRQNAMNTVQNQQNSLNTWNLQEASLQAQARENSINRASTASAANSSMAQRTALFNKAEQTLKTGLGGDGKVSPKTWNSAMQSFIAQGGDPSVFIATYGYRVNTKHKSDYNGY